MNHALRHLRSDLPSSRRGVAALVALGLLSGCISIGPEAPDSLLTLTARAEPAPGDTGRGAQTALILDEFAAEARIAAPRVPVRMENARIAYLTDATWVERPPRLFQRMLAETIRARSGRLVIDEDTFALEGPERLTGTLREFGYDARTGSVVVVVDAMLMSEAGGVEGRRFRAERPGVPAEGVPVGAALDDAANEVATAIADWLAASG
jgi:cholesterol transport system auxiliary component